MVTSESTSGASSTLNFEQGGQEFVAGPHSITCDHRNIATKFVIHAFRHPNDLAIVDDGICMTYGELFQRASALAVGLRSEHRPDAVVAIHAHRDMNTPLAMIACLFANVTFVVIDASYVQQRILDILKLSGAKTLLHGDLDDGLRSSIACLGVEMRPIHRGREPSAVHFSIGAQKTAYLLFTSGSTGFPKGIRTGHAPLVHFIEWYRQEFQPGHGSRFSMLAGLSHDPLLRDIFVPLSTGGQLHIPRQTDILVPDRLFSWMDVQGIEFTHLTPQLIDILHMRRKRKLTLRSLRFVFSGGDVLRPETAEHVENIAPGANLVNFYGTSETPQAMAYQVIEPDMLPPYPLGLPIADVDIEIVNDELHPMPIGEVGEIAIATEYLSDGYITDPSTASARGRSQIYVTRSVGDVTQKMYLTGDLGFKDNDGRIFFRGRSDDQVKIRGYRVDCLEVAATIERHRLARQVVVLPEQVSSGEKALVAFVVGDTELLKRVLPTVMPAHMVPATIIGISKIPLLPNGKTDRAMLYKLRCESLERERLVRSPQDNAFFEAIASALDLANLDPDKSLVSMGGDSLSFIRVGFVVEDQLGLLPEGWETIPFSELLELKRHAPAPTSSVGKVKLKQIEPAILLRAISILFVVLVHAQIDFYVTATSTLFVIAGMSFARFLLPGLIETGSLAPTARFILKYGVPAALWQGVGGLYKGQFWLPEIFLLGTLWASPAHHLTFWFLDILTVSILIIAGLASVLSRGWRQKARDTVGDVEFRFSVAMLTFAIVAFLLQTQLNIWNGVVGESSVGPFRWLWLVTLGMVIQTGRYRLDRVLVTLVSLALAGLCYGDLVTKGEFQQPFGLFLMGSILVLIWIRRIRVPAFSYGPVLLLAQHSLFIYLFSMWVPKSLTPKLELIGIEDWVPLRLLLALAVGIVMSMLWNRFLGLLSVCFGRIRTG